MERKYYCWKMRIQHESHKFYMLDLSLGLRGIKSGNRVCLGSVRENNRNPETYCRFHLARFDGKIELDMSFLIFDRFAYCFINNYHYVTARNSGK